jgi:hypothetical protein
MLTKFLLGNLVKNPSNLQSYTDVKYQIGNSLGKLTGLNPLVRIG